MFRSSLLEGRTVQIPGRALETRNTRSPKRKSWVGYALGLGVPMLREGIPIGVFGLARSEVRPYPTSKSQSFRTMPTKR